MEYWAMIEEVNWVENLARWFVELPAPELAYSAKVTWALGPNQAVNHQKPGRRILLTYWVVCYSIAAILMGIQVRDRKSSLSSILTCGINNIRQRAVLVNGSSILWPRPAEVDIAHEINLGVSSRLNMTWIKDIYIVRVRSSALSNTGCLCDHKVSQMPPEDEDKGPEAVIVPALTDAIILFLM